MKQEKRLNRLLALALCLALLLSGCGAPAASGSGAPDSASSAAPDSAASVPEEPEEPPYTGPLYEVAVEDPCESLPGFERLSINIGDEYTEEYKAHYMFFSGQIEAIADYKSEEFRLMYDPDDKEAYQALKEQQEVLQEKVYDAKNEADQLRALTDLYCLQICLNSAITPEFAEHSSDIFFYTNSSTGDYILYEKSRDALTEEERDAGFGWGEGFLTNSALASFPELDKCQLEGTFSGYTVFCQSEEDRHFFLTDGDGNVVYTAPDNITLRDYHGQGGMLRVYDTDTEELCLLNLEDYSLLRIPEGYSIDGYTRYGQPVAGCYSSGEFSEGLAAVDYAESTDTLFHIRGANGGNGLDPDSAESDIAGYIDKTGAFALQFSELPQFEDQIIVRASEFHDGKAIILYRPRTTTAGGSVLYEDMFLGAYAEIDTEGNILRECTEDDWWEQANTYRTPSFMYDVKAVPADRVLVADDLVLYKNKEAGQYELMDANGNVYPLKVPKNILSVRVLGNGMIFLCCGDRMADSEALNAFGPVMQSRVTSYYFVRVTDIRPEDLVVDTAGFEPDAMNIRDFKAAQ